MDYWLVAWRLLMSFILVLFFFQLSGSKRQFTQMTSFDLISNFLLSAVLGGFCLIRKRRGTVLWRFCPYILP